MKIKQIFSRFTEQKSELELRYNFEIPRNLITSYMGTEEIKVEKDKYNVQHQIKEEASRYGYRPEGFYLCSYGLVGFTTRTMLYHAEICTSHPDPDIRSAAINFIAIAAAQEEEGIQRIIENKELSTEVRAKALSSLLSHLKYTSKVPDWAHQVYLDLFSIEDPELFPGEFLPAKVTSILAQKTFWTQQCSDSIIPSKRKLAIENLFRSRSFSRAGILLRAIVFKEEDYEVLKFLIGIARAYDYGMDSLEQIAQEIKPLNENKHLFLLDLIHTPVEA